ncbi:MAG: VaFE repeat-containing surface-anchored protein [Eubacterium sp.]|nr:VaFE repeat-containing surface-anchored protein [Eubacterium sp.]
MTGKRLFAGLLAAAIAAGGPAVYGAGQEVTDRTARTPAALYFDMNEGGCVSVQMRDAEQQIYETVLSVEGDQAVISEQILQADGTPAGEPVVRNEQYENNTWCLETETGREIALQVAPDPGYTVTVCDLTDVDGHTESIRDRLDADGIFVQAGKTERVRIVFSADPETAGSQEELSALTDAEAAGSHAGVNETDESAVHSAEDDMDPEAETDAETGASDPEGQEAPDGQEAEPAESEGRFADAAQNPESSRTEHPAKAEQDTDQLPEETLSGADVTKQEAGQKLTDAVIEQYLLEHVDENYTKKDFLQVVNLMNAQQTLFSAAYLPEGTALDQAMTEDRYLDHWLGSYRYIVPVYWMSETSDYYVAFLNTMQNDANASVRDVSFAENNTAGNAVSGCIFDRDTGIVYIPAALYHTAEDAGAMQIGTIQAQLLQAVSGTADGTEAASVCEVLTGREKTLTAETAAEPVLDLKTTVQTAAGMNPGKLQVAVNGLPLTEDYYSYNRQTGELTIAMSSAAVATVDVTEEKTGILEKIAGAVGARTVYAVTENNMPNVYKNLKLKLPSYVQAGMYLQGNIIDTMMSNGTDAYNELKDSEDGVPNVYAYEYTHGHLDYAWDEKNSDGSFKHAAGELIDLIYNGERQETVSGETVTRKLKYSKLSMYTDAWWQVLNFSHADSKSMNVYTAEGKKTDDPKVSLSALGNIPLTCSHITCPLGNISSGVQDPDEDDLDSGAVNLRVKVRVRVFERNEEEGYAVLGVLAAHHRVAAGEADNGQTGAAVFKVAIEPTTAGMHIRKTSAAPAVSEGNSLYSLADAVYTIYKDEACTQKAGEFRTNAEGVSNTVTLQMGTAYWYKETTAPKGYYPDKKIRKIQLDGNEAEYVETVSEEPKEAIPDLLVGKVDSETGEAVPQGDASLEGAEFTVRHYCAENASGEPLHTWIFRTDAEGGIRFDENHLVNGTFVRNAAGKNTFPLGYYTFEETKTPAGYLPAGKTFAVSLLESGEGVRWSDPDFLKGFRAEEPVMHGNIQVTKQDIELNRAEALAGGSLAGIRFEVKNASREPVMYQGKKILSGETVLVLETDENGAASTGENTLPYGTYTVQELPSDKQQKSASDSYLLSDTGVHAMEIRQDGETKQLICQDQIKRSALTFRKTDDTDDKGMARIPFVLELTETGERHVILTDGNGCYSTEKYAHSLETNRLDSLLESDSEADVIPDEALQDYEYGTWFGTGREGSNAPVNDTLGALPYGNYVLNELRCKANQGHQLIQDYAFTIEEDGERFDFNNLRNRPEQMTIGTTMTDAGSGGHDASLGEDERIHLTDAVECHGLTAGVTYLLQAVLMEQVSEDVFRAENEEKQRAPVKGELQFTADGEDMTVHVPLSAFVPPQETLQVVAFEKLYAVTEDGKRGQMLASHEDITDAGQTVRIPAIRTEAADRSTGSHTGTTGEAQDIIDTVSYSGLIPGGTYEVSGYLIDHETGEELLVGGKPVQAASTFTAEEESGTVRVDFRLDSRELSGKTVVVFEELYRIIPEGEEGSGSGRILTAVHKDPEDAAQSVVYREPEQPPEDTPKEKKTPEKKITPAPTKKPDKPVITTEPEITKRRTPVTGDPAGTVLFAGICTAAACGIVVLIHIILHRKRR